MIRTWIEVIDSSDGQYSVNTNIRFKTTILRLDLCEYSDAYIVVKGRISVSGIDGANRRNKKLTFKNNARFSTFIDNGQDLDIVMSM